MLKQMREQMTKLGGTRFVVYTDKKNIGIVVGHNSENKNLLLNEGITFKIKEKSGVYLKIDSAPNIF